MCVCAEGEGGGGGVISKSPQTNPELVLFVC